MTADSLCADHTTIAAPSAVQPHLAELSPQERQRAFALRFRTEMCRTFGATGRCDYRDRCMFAHGAVELRTEAMNEADGVVDDKAIRTWIRDRRRAARRARQLAKATAALAATTSVTVDDDEEQQCGEEEEDSTFLAASRDKSFSTSVEGDTTAAGRRTPPTPAAVVVAARVLSVYRFNPYSMLRAKQPLAVAG